MLAVATKECRRPVIVRPVGPDDRVERPYPIVVGFTYSGGDKLLPVKGRPRKMAGAISVLLLDRHQGVREALAQRLRHAPSIGCVATASTLDTALQAARDHAPHVVLYDPRTVAGDAAEAVQRLKQAVGHVIVLTSSLLEDEAAALRRAGVAALVLKGTEISALLTLMETILAE